MSINHASILSPALSYRLYVGNNGVRHNCEELLAEFESDVAKDGRIDLYREGDMSIHCGVEVTESSTTKQLILSFIFVSAVSQ